MSASASDPSDPAEYLESTVAAVPRQAAPGATDRRRPAAYLLVLEEDSSTVFPLPLTGNVVIGRAAGVDLLLRDPAVSRAHARLSITDGEAEISDLGSHNGTTVNDERVVGSRVVMSGDVIGICDTTLVYTSSRRAFTPVIAAEFVEFMRRVTAELDRSVRKLSPLTIVVIAVGPSAERQAVLRCLSPSLRGSDVAAWAPSDQLLLALPDTGLDAAELACARILQLLADVAPRAQVGTATCPAHGTELNVLLAGARFATTGAGPGKQASAADAFRTLVVGEREVVLADPAMVRTYALIQRLAATDLPVLVEGETGSGKDLVAAALHHWSARRDKPLLALNCAAIQEGLVESELFGHEKGAFSGAHGTKPGLLESAHGGTVFLDEIGELPPAIQAKLLRVLEDCRVTRLGGIQARQIDIRLVSATNRNLDREIESGRFRRDLFYRIGAGKMWLPPLRDRPREIPVLARAFLAKACGRVGRPVVTLSDGAMRMLARHNWPGNVRELKNLIDWLVATSSEPVIEEGQVAERLGVPVDSERDVAQGVAPTPLPGPPARDRTFRPLEEELNDLQRTRIAEALLAAQGNKTRAAELLCVPLRTFLRKLDQYGLARRSRP